MNGSDFMCVYFEVCFCLCSYVLCNDTVTTGILFSVRDVAGAVTAKLDVLSWQLHGVTVEEPEKLEDSHYLSEIQRRNFGSRSHKL
jgi:hypothetical protein